MMATMLKRRQIQFTDRQLKAIHREAARRGVSDSAVVREAVEDALRLRSAPRNGAALMIEYLKQHGLWEARSRRRKTNIAAEHDKYVFTDPRD